MESLDKLDSFIENCDSNEMQAFLQLIQTRFQEAQKAKEERFQKVLDSLYEKTLHFVRAERRRLKRHVLSSLAALKDKHQHSTSALCAHLENVRAQKRSLVSFFQEQGTLLKALEQEAEQTIKAFHAKREALSLLHKRQLESFRRCAAKRIAQAREESLKVLESASSTDRAIDGVIARLDAARVVRRQTLQ